MPGSAGNPLKERGGEHKGRFSAQVNGCHASYNYNLQSEDSDIEAYLITIFSTPSLRSSRRLKMDKECTPGTPGELGIGH